jgi:hypothetical protein
MDQTDAATGKSVIPVEAVSVKGVRALHNARGERLAASRGVSFDRPLRKLPGGDGRRRGASHASALLRRYAPSHWAKRFALCYPQGFCRAEAQNARRT